MGLRRLILLDLGGDDFCKSSLEYFRTFLIINAKIASGLLKPPVLIFLTWLCRLWLFGFCHMASQ